MFVSKIKQAKPSVMTDNRDFEQKLNGRPKFNF